jgi:hypothetical protein
MVGKYTIQESDATMDPVMEDDDYDLACPNKEILEQFHVIIHPVEDITLFGVPSVADTGSNESHHKPSKHVRSSTSRCRKRSVLD